jgi:hypothetical protein
MMSFAQIASRRTEYFPASTVTMCACSSAYARFASQLAAHATARSGSPQPTASQQAEHRIDITRYDNDHRADHAVVVRQGQLVAVTVERDEVVLRRIVIAVASSVEVQHARVKRDGDTHIAATHHRNQRHGGASAINRRRE